MKPNSYPPSPDGRRSDPGRSAGSDQRDRPAPATGPHRFARTLALLALVVGVYVLHQDFWNWQRIEPLLFGFIPAGLAYHVAYSIGAALMMAVLVKFAWPAHFEIYEQQEPEATDRHRESES
jgi:hypothetical protein